MKLKLEVGWFPGELFTLFHFELFGYWGDSDNEEEFTIISIKIEKFAISLYWCLDYDKE